MTDAGTEGQCSTATACYVYDAEGHRVRATVNGQTRDFIYDLSGRNIDEFTPGGSGWLGTWTRGEAYAGSLHIATYANGTTEFDNSDWLSTFRARSDVSGNRIETCTSLPFGEDLTCTGTEVTPIHFTGKERDTESGNDFFEARYYTSTMGRFLTPDWAEKPTNVPYAHFGNPQSLNLYSYVQNNPTTVGDPDGHDGGGPDASWQTDPQAKANGVEQGTKSLAAQVPPEAKAAIADALKASNSPTADDKKGGFHEESVKWGTDASGNVIVSPSVPGAYAPPGTNPTTNFTPANPQTDQNLSTVDGFAHIHPKGGDDRSFVQGPSAADLKFAGQSSAINIVVGAADKKVYFFNGSGVIDSPMKLKDFMGGSQ